MCRLGALLALALQAPADDAKELRALMDQLRSDEVEVRDSARATLVRRGRRTLELLADTPPPEDSETTARLRDVAARNVERTVAAPVTLELRDVSVKDAVESLRKQTAFRVEFEEDIGPDPVVREPLRFSGVPFAEALRRVLEPSGLTLLERDRERVRVGRVPRLTFRFTQTDPEVMFKMVTGLAGVTIRRELEGTGRVDYECDGLAWTSLVDDLAEKLGAVSLRTSAREIVVRRKREFERDLKTKSFPLRHLRPEDFDPDNPGRWTQLLWSLDAELTRGADWATVRGKWAYEPWKRAIVVTDRDDVLERVAKIVDERDRKD